jgi:hypothetical protein
MRRLIERPVALVSAVSGTVRCSSWVPAVGLNFLVDEIRAHRFDAEARELARIGLGARPGGVPADLDAQRRVGVEAAATESSVGLAEGRVERCRARTRYRARRTPVAFSPVGFAAAAPTRAPAAARAEEAPGRGGACPPGGAARFCPGCPMGQPLHLPGFWEACRALVDTVEHAVAIRITGAAKGIHSGALGVSGQRSNPS